MSTLLRTLFRDDSAVSSIEYAVLAVGIALVVLTAAQFLGGSIASAFTGIANAVTTGI